MKKTYEGKLVTNGYQYSSIGGQDILVILSDNDFNFKDCRITIETVKKEGEYDG